jgi:hypothetical protein
MIHTADKAEGEDRQLKAIVKIADFSGMNATLQSDEFSRADFFLWKKGDKHKRTAVVGEIKGVKRYRADDYPFPTLIVDKAKLETLEGLAREVGAVPIVFFYFDECGTVFSRRGPFGHYPTKVIERKDRDDPLDRDLVAEIPIAACKRF